MDEKNFLYKQIYEEILSAITEGRFPEGSKLDKESDIAKQYKVSAITVKKAMALLKEQGLIRRIPGVGTFITDQLADILQERALARNEKISKENCQEQPVIGVILEHISSPFGLDMMYYLDMYARNKGYQLIVRFSYNSQDIERNEIEFLLAMGVKALIIMPLHSKYYNTKLLQLVIDDFPVVLIDKRLEGLPVPAVYSDNRDMVYTLVKALQSHRHLHIGRLGTASDGVSSNDQRAKAFDDMVKKMELPLYPPCQLGDLGSLQYSADDESKASSFSQEDVSKIVRYLEENQGITALVVMEYRLLKPLYEAIKQMGRKIPEDYSVVSIDEDYENFRGCYFTHVKQDEKSIASSTIKLLTEAMEKNVKPLVRDYKIKGIFKSGSSVKLLP